MSTNYKFENAEVETCFIISWCIYGKVTEEEPTERQGDLPRCQEHSRQEHNAEAPRSSRRDPVRRQQEQELLQKM